MFSLPDDDEGDFSLSQPASSSKLASLFGMDQASFEGGNSSLTYTAPKQPKTKDQTAAESKIAESKASGQALLHAAAAHTFRYVNGQYVKQGKLGMAVLGNHTEKEYKLLLYVSQKQPVAAAKIGVSFAFTVQKDNYASFYDDQAQMWSVCFDSEKDQVTFSKWVAVAKLQSAPPPPPLVKLDIIAGEGQSLQSGDMLEAQYTGWLITNGTIGKVFDSNVQSGKTFKVKLGKGKVIRGWDDGIVGMKKGSKRILAIPASMAYGLKGVPNQIPPSAELLFEIDVRRVKFANPESAESNAVLSKGVAASEPAKPNPTVLATPEPHLPKLASSDGSSASEQSGAPTSQAVDAPNGPKSRSDSVKSLSQSLTDKATKGSEESSDKSQLLARMSKMGHAMLPGAASPSSVEDDDVEERMRGRTKSGGRSSRPNSTSPIDGEPSHRPVLHPKPDNIGKGDRPPSRSNSQTDTSHQRAHLQQQQQQHHQHQQQQHQHDQPPQATGYGYQAPASQQPLALYQPPMANMYGMGAVPAQAFSTMTGHMQPSEINMMTTENRLHMTETRVAVTKVADKMEELLTKMTRLEATLAPPGSALMPLGRGSPADMETSVLMHNITRIIQENDQLKKDCAEKTTKVDALNEKVSDLLHRNQKFLEKSNTLMEERADSIQSKSAETSSKLQSLQEKNAVLSAELSAVSVKLTAYQTQLQLAQQEKEAAQVKVQQLQGAADRLQQRLDNTDTHASEHEEELSQLRAVVKEHKKERKQLQLHHEQLEEEVHDLKQEKEAMQKSLEDRKKKQMLDKKKANEEMEELRLVHEDELASIKERFRKGNEAEKLLKLEAEINAKWQKKLDEEILNWKQQVAELEEWKRKATAKLDVAQVETEAGNEAVSQGLQEQIDELSNRNSELETSLECVYSEREAQQRHAEEERAAAVTSSYDEGFQAGKETAAPNSSSSALPSQVKAIMNRVFMNVRDEFEAGHVYDGKEVTSTMLSIIKEETLLLINPTADDGQENDSTSDDEAESVQPAEETAENNENTERQSDSEADEPTP